MTSASYDTQANETYDYDSGGNRTDGSYDSTLYNRLTTDGTYDYKYDDEGNVIARYEDTSAGNGLDSGDTNITDYAYDHRNRLVSVSTRATYASSPVLVAEYAYDPFDRRIATTYPGGTSTRELYVYDEASPSPFGRGRGEGPGGGNVLLDFLDPDADDELEPFISRRYLNGPALSPTAVDQVLAQENFDGEGSPTGAVWLLTDHQGTTRDVVSYDDGTDETIVETHFAYTAYGAPLDGDTSLTRFLYAGLAYEAASGLHFSATRTYDPVTARWNSPDWIGVNGGDANFYRYAGNSPTNAVDPTGFQYVPQGAGTNGANPNMRPSGVGAHHAAATGPYVNPFVPNPLVNTSRGGNGARGGGTQRPLGGGSVVSRGGMHRVRLVDLAPGQYVGRLGSSGEIVTVRVSGDLIFVTHQDLSVDLHIKDRFAFPPRREEVRRVERPRS